MAISNKVISVGVLGASALRSYTEEILSRGLVAFDHCFVSDRELIRRGAMPVIAQIHGAEHSFQEDTEILQLITEVIHGSERPVIILVHRPKEVQTRLPQLQELLLGLKRVVALVHLGPNHLDDEFYFSPFCLQRVIPHGFFSAVPPPIAGNLVLGSHTTWGELRSVKVAAKLISAVASEQLRLPAEQRLNFYLGGSGAESELIKVAMQEMLGKEFPIRESTTPEATEAILREAKSGGTLVLANTSTSCYQPHFNLQLYQYAGAPRMDESSGSLHRYPAIPVIFEMNGAEAIEDLRVIKVPYPARGSAELAGFSAAAKNIVALIAEGKVVGALAHNAERALVMNREWVALQYISLYEEISSDR